MARRKTGPDLKQTRAQLAERLRACRIERFGHRGGALMARQLGVPVRTWYNYESGVTVPAEVLLRFLELMNLEPLWLLDGQEPRYRAQPTRPDRPPAAAGSVRDLLRQALDWLEPDPAPGGRWARPQHAPSPAFAVSPRPPRSRGSVRPAVTTAADCDGAGHGHGAIHRPSPGSDGHAQGDDRSFGTPRTCEDEAPPPDEPGCVRVMDAAMEPIIAPGALAAHAAIEEPYEALAGGLVVAWIDGEPIVRWFGVNGRFGWLRAENDTVEAGTRLIDLQGPSQERRVRRLLWISTPHGRTEVCRVPAPATSSRMAPGRG